MKLQPDFFSTQIDHVVNKKSSENSLCLQNTGVHQSIVAPQTVTNCYWLLVKWLYESLHVSHDTRV